jgi:hypothetical protein
MSKKEYWELLRDPRWQRMRLEVMQRDDFRCRYCGVNDKTLNVHHTYYAKGRAPWEYDAESLLTLCEACHQWVETDTAELRKLIGAIGEYDRWIARGYLRALLSQRSHKDPVLIPVPDFHDAIGIADAYGIRTEDVQGLEVDGFVNRAAIEYLAAVRLRQLYIGMAADDGGGGG